MEEQTQIQKNIKIKKSRVSQLNEYLSDSKNKSYFVVAVTVIFFIVFVFLGVIPSIRSIISQTSKNAEIQKAINRTSTKLRFMQQMVTEQSTKQSLIENFNSLFPNTISQESAIEDLYSLAEQNNIYILNLTFPDDRRRTAQSLAREFRVGPNVKSQAINLNAESNRDSIQNFIENLENSRRVFNIRTVTISKKTGEALINAGFDKEFNLSMVLEYFYWDGSNR